MITTRRHNQIVTALEDRHRLELREARDLKTILQKMTGMSINGDTFATVGGMWSITNRLPDDVAQYIDDYFGGKVIKQEATKVIVIEKSGEVKTGLTKQPADKGFSYKLVRKS